MAFHVNYSRLERCLHRLAFASPAVQLVAADIERTVCGAIYRDAVPRMPIFITSLPRAGTTALLEAISRLPGTATHLYRDMPFVLAPVLWSRLSSRFRVQASLRERAHGDGMLVGEDSPEAFEEVLWHALWPERYTTGRIPLWSAADNTESTRRMFVEHMRKVIALRHPDCLEHARYVSKNNANIARLEILPRMLPDAFIVVPVRHPVAHAISLLRQHRHFLAMHEAEPFTRRYMRDIGHYEFGALHQPIAFPRLDQLTAGRSPLTLEYWLGYWIAAFEYVLAHRDVVICVSYDDLCAEPGRALGGLLRRCEIDDGGALEAVASTFRRRTASDQPDEALAPALLEHALQIHEALLSREA